MTASVTPEQVAAHVEAGEMPKHPDCAQECQQAVDYGVWPERSCSPRCVWLARATKGGEAGEMPTADQVIELAQALEQKRGLQIVADVKALGACLKESHFQYGWESACEEIEERLRTEEWPLCLKPVGNAAPKGEAGEMEAAKGDRK